MIDIKGIIEGHINELKSVVGVADMDDEKIFAIRGTICNSCPLKNGNTCNSNKGIHPITMDVTEDRTKTNQGYRFGCGCRLSAKIRTKGHNCPAGFWGGEFNNR